MSQEPLNLPPTTGTLGSVFAAINKVAGTTFVTGTSTAKEVLFIRAKSGDVDGLKKAIAAATGAEWMKDSEGDRLVRSETLARQQSKAEAAERAEELKKVLADMTKRAQLDQTFDSESAEKLRKEFETARTEMQQQFQNGDAQRGPGNGGRGAGFGRQMMELGSRTPSSRAILRILNSLDMTRIAAMEPGERLVFATPNTSMQVPLGGGVLKSMQAFINEQRTMNPPRPQTAQPADEAPQVDPGAPGDTELPAPAPGQDRNGRGGRGPGGGPGGGGPFGGPGFGGGQVGEGNPTKVLLVFNRFGEGTNYNVTLTVFNENGQQITSGNTQLNLIDRRNAMTAGDGKGTAIELSPLAKEQINLVLASNPFGRGPGGPFGNANREQAKPSPDLLQTLTQPDKSDPLALAVQDVMTALADQYGDNVVANIPDAILGNVVFASRGTLLAEMLVQQLPLWGLEVQKLDGWTVIKPTHLAEARDSRVDRKALAAMARTVASGQQPTLDQEADFTFKMPENGNPFFSLDTVTLRALGSDLGGGFGPQRGEKDALRFYGSLTGSQRQSLLNGGRVSIGSLGKPQMEIVNKLVFWSMDGPNVAVQTTDQTQQGRRGNNQRFQGNRGGFGGFGRQSGLSGERTEVLPNGVPSNGYVQGTYNRTDGVVGVNADGTTGRFMTAPELARMRQIQSRMNDANADPNAQGNGNRRMPPGMEQQYTKFRVASRGTLTLTFVLAPQVSMARSLQADFNSSGQAVAFESLPTALLQQVDQMNRAMTERRGNMGGPNGQRERVGNEGPRRARGNRNGGGSQQPPRP